MIEKRIILSALAVFLLILAAGCGDRTNPADPEPPQSGLKPVLQYSRIFDASSLPTQTWTNYRERITRIYTPPGYPIDFSGSGRKYPTLYLLHDLNGDEVSFLKNRIDLIADRLIASGEIQPMVIVMPDMETLAGGTFYTDGWTMYNPDIAGNNSAGDFETAIAEDLIRIMEADAFVPPDTIAFNIITRRASRAIGGIGTGGYGALRIALRHPELFSSVSIMNGFVSFADSDVPGSGDRSALIDLADSVFAENGVTQGDLDGFYNSIDTAYNKPYTNLFFVAAASFSPHDPEATDTTTTIRRYQIDLPFDHNGEVYQPVLDRWIENDLVSDESMFEESGLFGHLDSTAVYIEFSENDQFYANDQCRDLMAKLNSRGIDFEWSSYAGYQGFPAQHGNFIYDRIEQILKFHSRNLSADPGN